MTTGIAYPTETRKPDHFHRPPQPWDGIGADWYCRERRPANVYTAEAEAATADLIDTLTMKPDAYWLRPAAERELVVKYQISAATSRQLMRDCPGSASPEPEVWCAVAAAPLWYDFKRKVREALPADALMTLEEIAAAMKADAGSVLAALAVLCDRDGSAVCIQDDGDQAPRFVRARPGGARASYSDLVAAQPAP
jgi:hypothetical protein